MGDAKFLKRDAAVLTTKSHILFKTRSQITNMFMDKETSKRGTILDNKFSSYLDFKH